MVHVSKAVVCFLSIWCDYGEIFAEAVVPSQISARGHLVESVVKQHSEKVPRYDSDAAGEGLLEKATREQDSFVRTDTWTWTLTDRLYTYASTNGKMESVLLGMGESVLYARIGRTAVIPEPLLPQVKTLRDITIAFTVLLFAGICAREFFLSRLQRGSFDRGKIQMMFLCFVLVGSINSTVLIPSSYNLSTSLGWGATASGFLLGCGYMMAPVGALIGNCLMRSWNQPRLRMLCIIMFLLISLNTLAFGLLLLSESAYVTHAIWQLFFIRSVNSVIFGFGIVLKCMVFKATPAEERVQLSIGSVACTNAGFCLGPLLGSAMMTAFGGGVVPLSAQVSSALPMFPLGVTFALLALSFSFFVPDDLDKITSTKEANAQLQPSKDMAPEDLPTSSRQIIIMVSALFCLERGFTVSAIEAATALILELQYSWQPERIGFGIGIVFAATVCLALCVESIKASRKLHDMVLLPMLAITSVLGTLLLLNVPGMPPETLFAGDAVVYSCAYTVNGMMEGLASRAALPGTWYSMENYMLARVWLGSFARFVSPAAARYTVATYGRNAYVFAQFFVAMSACLSIFKLVGIRSRATPLDKLRGVGGPP